MTGNANEQSIGGNKKKTMLKFPLPQDFIQFEKKMYKQNEGLSISSPLSPSMAEIFIEYVENRILCNTYNWKIKHWFNYVNDCFILWNIMPMMLTKFRII